MEKKFQSPREHAMPETKKKFQLDKGKQKKRRPEGRKKKPAKSQANSMPKKGIAIRTLADGNGKLQMSPRT